MVGHGYGAGLGFVFAVVKGDYGREDAREDAMQDERGVQVEPPLEYTIWY